MGGAGDYHWFRWVTERLGHGPQAVHAGSTSAPPQTRQVPSGANGVSRFTIPYILTDRFSPGSLARPFSFGAARCLRMVLNWAAAEHVQAKAFHKMSIRVTSLAVAALSTAASTFLETVIRVRARSKYDTRYGSTHIHRTPPSGTCPPPSAGLDANSMTTTAPSHDAAAHAGGDAPDETIALWIHSPGGSVPAMLAIRIF